MRPALSRAGWYSLYSSLLLALCMLYSCVDPVSPDFAYLDGLVYIDALASTAPGASYVDIRKTTMEFGSQTNRFLSGASVTFINTSTALSVPLKEAEEAYVPPADFAAVAGETWQLRVVLASGEEYLSEPETIRSGVPLQDLHVSYTPELFYSGEFKRFVPGHRISADLQDPPGETNYYYWRFRSFETHKFCKICFNSIYRSEGCIPWDTGSGPPLLDFYTYYCDSECWRIRYSDEVQIFSDRFSDGKDIKALPVANIPLHNKENIVVELEQFTLSESAYQYLKTLKDLVDNNSGLNAPLPAALVGNLYNPADRDEFVLGRFTAAAASTKSVFIDRSAIPDEPLDDEVKPQVEGPEAPPYQVYTSPCAESRYVTSHRPPGWQD